MRVNRPIVDINHAFGVRITKVRLMRRTVVDLRRREKHTASANSVCVCVFVSVCNMYHSLIDGIRCFIREDARGQTGHHLHHPDLMSGLQHVVIYVNVVSLK